MNKSLRLSALLAAGAFVPVGTAGAQVAGSSTTIGVTITEASQLALGWSVKKGILGKTVYNDAGEKVGSVEDLIIDPERNVSYVIIGAGGLIGMGRHDVAVPIAQIHDQAGKLVMPGATKGRHRGTREEGSHRCRRRQDKARSADRRVAT